jgi:1-acyl-sn-glycerol-3-phosphate acyltransferase
VKPSRFAALSLRFAGWKYEGDVPTEKKCVCLAVPHTSNWDGLLLVTMLRSIGLPMEWMIKDSWVKGPLGPIVRGAGGLGINRSQSSNVVDQMIEQFRTRDTFILGIPPEGTRSLAPQWKSGFYHIAVGANVPVVPGYLDYGRKRAGLGKGILMTGNVREDMDRIRAYYAEKKPVGHDHANFGPIRLREES